jgi:hypothetical protein
LKDNSWNDGPITRNWSKLCRLVLWISNEPNKLQTILVGMLCISNCMPIKLLHEMGHVRCILYRDVPKDNLFNIGVIRKIEIGEYIPLCFSTTNPPTRLFGTVRREGVVDRKMEWH